MSFRQLIECRDLERLAKELNFVLDSSNVTSDILLRCREFTPSEDLTGQTVVPHTAWLPYGSRSAIVSGSVSEILMFLRGVQFMKTYAENHLRLKKQMEKTQKKYLENLQHSATMKKISE